MEPAQVQVAAEASVSQTEDESKQELPEEDLTHRLQGAESLGGALGVMETEVAAAAAHAAAAAVEVVQAAVAKADDATVKAHAKTAALAAAQVNVH
jgi:hypothetical protein